MSHTSLAQKWEAMRIRHKHAHPIPRNVNTLDLEGMTPGQRIADSVTATMGSWTFIIIQSILLFAWIVANVIAWIRHWDPYPFILLNLALSFQAAYAAPIIMMSQNRQSAKDRLMAEQDYIINTKAEEEVKAIMLHLEQQDEAMIDLLRRLEDQHATIIEVLNVSRQAPGKNSSPG